MNRKKVLEKFKKCNPGIEVSSKATGKPSFWIEKSRIKWPKGFKLGEPRERTFDEVEYRCKMYGVPVRVVWDETFKEYFVQIG